MYDIGERVKDIAIAYRKNDIVTESVQMKNIKNIMSLSVDCLRLHMYAEQSQLKQEEGEKVCQALQQ